MFRCTPLWQFPRLLCLRCRVAVGRIGLLCTLFLGVVGVTQGMAVEREEIKIADAAGTPDALSLYRISPSTGDGPFPVVLLFHGGAWRKGSPSQFFYYGTQMAEAGFTVYSAQYRLVGKETESVEDCVVDAEAALRWICDHAQEQNVDVNNFFIGGGSAGGQLALYLFLTNTGEPNRFRGFIGYNPVVDVEHSRFAKLFEASNGKYNPMALVDYPLPPMIFFHGTNDDIVPIAEVYEMKSRAEFYGAQVEVVVFDGAGHSFFNTGKATDETKARLNEKAIAFLDANLAPSGGPD